MLSLVLIIFIFFFVLLPLFIYLYPLYKNRGVYNLNTGKHPKVFNFFIDMFLSMIYSEAEFLKYKETANAEPLYAKYFLTGINYTTTDHLTAKLLQSDDKTFVKQTLTMGGPIGKFIGAGGVAMANGDTWKRQRKAMNPAFYDLEHYSKIFSEKAEITVNKIWDNSKDGIVTNFPDFMQKMTLDILGKTIFDHEFNSLENSNQKYLNAYNSLAETMFNPKEILKVILLGKLKFLPMIGHLNQSADVLDELVDSLITQSQKKIEENRELTTLLDFMVESHFSDEESQHLSRKEVRGFLSDPN
jgi:cytochrome P450